MSIEGIEFVYFLMDWPVGQRKFARNVLGTISPLGYFWHARCIEYCAKSKDYETVPGI